MGWVDRCTSYFWTPRVQQIYWWCSCILTKFILQWKGAENTRFLFKHSLESAFMAVSKGHVSLWFSLRGNYPFPVTEQQMIANYRGTFAVVTFINCRKKIQFNCATQLHMGFWAFLLFSLPRYSSLHIYFLNFFSGYFFPFFVSSSIFTLCTFLLK